MLPFIAFFAWLFLFGMSRRKACPDCGKPLPSIQSPFTKTKRQWIEGGYVCKNCGCEADLAGTKQQGFTDPPRRSLVTEAAVLTLLTASTFVLLAILFQR